MNIVTTVKEWTAIRSELNQKIGFVPTMGNLHAGHLALINRAKSENDLVVVSIFVNPTQFNQESDLQTYPRTLDEDYEKLKSIGVNYVFVPRDHEIYGDHYEVRVQERVLSVELEGAARPGHFEGMLTVVMKLLNLISPMKAYFGEKDYQQLLLVKKMVNALFMPVEIIACETVRADDGLALSSRNSRLSASQRKNAALFIKLLRSSLSDSEIKDELTRLGFKVDYIVKKWSRRLGAVWLGEVRLIDNIALVE